MWRITVTALVLVALLAGPLTGRASREPGRAKTATGQFLVATEALGDPRFVETVVYVVHHDAGGAMGLVVNRPLAKVPVAELLRQLGLDAEGAGGDVQLYYGGPVEPGRGFVLHTTDYQGEGTRELAAGIALTVNPSIVKAIGEGQGPKRHLIALGYAGWAAGQLESEIAAGAWVIVTADTALLFDERAETKWERAMARHRMITL